MIQKNEIRDQLLGYLSRRISLDDFQDWLVQQSWDMHRDSDAASQDVVGQIELLLSEYDGIANFSERALKRQLLDLVNDIQIDVASSA